MDTIDLHTKIDVPLPTFSPEKAAEHAHLRCDLTDETEGEPPANGEGPRTAPQQLPSKASYEGAPDTHHT